MKAKRLTGEEAGAGGQEEATKSRRTRFRVLQPSADDPGTF